MRAWKDGASQLTTIARLLQRNAAMRKNGPTWCTDWVLLHDCCALVVSMKTPVIYKSMVDNVRRWCGRDYMASMSWWDIEEAEGLVPSSGCPEKQLHQEASLAVRLEAIQSLQQPVCVGDLARHQSLSSAGMFP